MYYPSIRFQSLPLQLAELAFSSKNLDYHQHKVIFQEFLVPFLYILKGQPI
jgi:hypothetical protein